MVYFAKHFVHKMNFLKGCTMDGRQETQEKLLQAWMAMSIFIRGNRILTDFSFNEIMICGMLFRQENPLTATELCERTSLLKSQVNHILTGMENRGLIERVRSTADKRVIYVYLLEAGREAYIKEHAGVMEILNQIYDTLGAEKTGQLTALIQQATAVVNDYQRRT